MRGFRTLLSGLWSDTRAVTATEYALLGALLAMAVLFAAPLAGGALNGFYGAIAARLVAAAALIGA